MWRSLFAFLKQAASLSAVRYRPKPPLGSTAAKWTAPFSSDASSGAACGAGVVGGDGNGGISFEEAKKLMRLVNVEALKTKLGVEGKEVIEYSDLLEACESMGVARSRDEAVVFARVLDDAGVVLLFRDRVYLHPDKHRLSVWSRTRNWKREFMKLPSFIFSGFLCTLDPNQFVWDHLRGEFHIRILHQDWDVDKVVELIRRVVPLSLTSEDDPRRNELKQLQEKKEEIDMLAHRQVRRILWSGLGFSILQVGLFFRLTFWEFSWDVMEPITFFTTATGIIIGYGYFLFTSRDPTYQDLMKRLFLSRQRKLIRRHNFDVNRFLELQKICRSPLDGPTLTFAKQKVGVDLEDSLS